MGRVAEGRPFFDSQLEGEISLHLLSDPETGPAPLGVSEGFRPSGSQPGRGRPSSRPEAPELPRFFSSEPTEGAASFQHRPEPSGSSKYISFLFLSSSSLSFFLSSFLFLFFLSSSLFFFFGLIDAAFSFFFSFSFFFFFFFFSNGCRSHTDARQGHESPEKEGRDDFWLGEEGQGGGDELGRPRPGDPGNRHSFGCRASGPPGLLKEPADRGPHSGGPPRGGARRGEEEKIGGPPAEQSPNRCRRVRLLRGGSENPFNDKALIRRLLDGCILSDVVERIDRADPEQRAWDTLGSFLEIGHQLFAYVEASGRMRRDLLRAEERCQDEVARLQAKTAEVAALREALERERQDREEERRVREEER
ncbi:uncharacterized protein [Elaeis guineensis]|uniref:uncharacterized protein n=1 Tax=Elaeis guineensis var. tenera TaxID=51953 RepID=UPI003C6D98E5